MLVLVWECLHDPLQELLQVLQNKMSFEPIKEHVQLISQESVTSPCQKLAQKPLQEPCVTK